jgi:hypothetical protein
VSSAVERPLYFAVAVTKPKHNENDETKDVSALISLYPSYHRYAFYPRPSAKIRGRKINFKNVAYFQPPHKRRFFTTFTTHSTTFLPSKNHHENSASPKTPLKNPRQTGTAADSLPIAITK